MKEIIIKLSNFPKIQSELDKAQAGCRERLLTIDDIEEWCETVQKHLGIPKIDLSGTTATLNPHAQKFANAYNGRPWQPCAMSVITTVRGGSRKS